MLERLGNVLYWLGMIVALLILSLPFIALLNGRSDSFFVVLGFSTIAALLSYGIGWSLRYILSGRK